jgi:cold shock CspA family protein
MMPNGTIKWFDTRGNYGLIVPEDGGADAFVDAFASERAGFGLRDRGQRLEHDPTATRGAAFLLSNRVRPHRPAHSVSRANAMDRRSAPSVCPPNHHHPENYRWPDCVPC